MAELYHPNALAVEAEPIYIVRFTDDEVVLTTIMSSMHVLPSGCAV